MTMGLFAGVIVAFGVGLFVVMLGDNGATMSSTVISAPITSTIFAFVWRRFREFRH